MKNAIIVALVVVVLGLGAFIFTRENTNSTTNTQSPASGTAEPAEQLKSSSPKELDLSNKNLTQVQKDILDDKNAIKLDVSDNALTGSLPAEIRKLTNLEVLDASNNKLTGIPAEIGQLENLREANFANNNISGLPLEIGKLKKLETLDLRGNPNLSKNDVGLIAQQIPNAKIQTD